MLPAARRDNLRRWPGAMGAPARLRAQPGDACRRAGGRGRGARAQAP